MALLSEFNLYNLVNALDSRQAGMTELYEFIYRTIHYPLHLCNQTSYRDV